MYQLTQTTQINFFILKRTMKGCVNQQAHASRDYIRKKKRNITCTSSLSEKKNRIKKIKNFCNVVAMILPLGSLARNRQMNK
ncbi:hypothetical protein BpHYR1_054262 [Brachionus plicatilis]|uniref:Uncharacterized protein n=1 Tax=Brachionus plicatilis TaxID=10195 RepID=A0A3M7T2R5_BRAPC|nr:hypothetical protein BpHYR1_054262 [Brachionus plicatilis]